MPAKSQAQRGFLAVKFGPEWMKEHHFDNKGKLPEHVKPKGYAKGTALVKGVKPVMGIGVTKVKIAPPKPTKVPYYPLKPRGYQKGTSNVMSQGKCHANRNVMKCQMDEKD